MAPPSPPTQVPTTPSPSKPEPRRPPFLHLPRTACRQRYLTAFLKTRKRKRHTNEFRKKNPTNSNTSMTEISRTFCHSPPERMMESISVESKPIRWAFVGEWESNPLPLLVQTFEASSDLNLFNKIHFLVQLDEFNSDFLSFSFSHMIFWKRIFFFSPSIPSESQELLSLLFFLFPSLLFWIDFFGLCSVSYFIRRQKMKRNRLQRNGK